MAVESEKIGDELMKLLETKFSDVSGKGTCIRFKATEKVHIDLLSNGILTTFYNGFIYLAPSLLFGDKQLEEFNKVIMGLKY